jgi:hypothetical protein
MDNVCRDCGRKFHSDLTFCPKCGGGARPARTRDWHYRHDGVMAHQRPVHEDEVRTYRQNAWILLSCAILLLPLWLMHLDGLNYHLGRWDLLDVDMLFFYLATSVLLLLGAAMVSAWQAKRPGLQVLVPGILVVHTTFWSQTALVLLLLIYFLVVILWGIGAGRSSRMDPTYLPVVSGVGMLSLVLTYLWILVAP